jgi:hypothetical protein
MFPFVLRFQLSYGRSCFHATGRYSDIYREVAETQDYQSRDTLYQSPKAVGVYDGSVQAHSMFIANTQIVSNGVREIVLH